jgi:hypothetical protein
VKERKPPIAMKKHNAIVNSLKENSDQNSTSRSNSPKRKSGNPLSEIEDPNNIKKQKNSNAYLSSSSKSSLISTPIKCSEKKQADSPGNKSNY